MTVNLLAAGQSWRWQLRDQDGQWVQMGSRVRWLARGRWRTGQVVDSPSPGMAMVRMDGSDQEVGISSSRLGVLPDAPVPDASPAAVLSERIRLSDAKRGDLLQFTSDRVMRVTFVDKRHQEVQGLLFDPADLDSEVLSSAVPFNRDGAPREMDRIHASTSPIPGTYEDDLRAAQDVLRGTLARYPNGLDVAVADATDDGAFNSPSAQAIRSDVEAVGAAFRGVVDREVRRRLYAGDLPEVQIPERASSTPESQWLETLTEARSQRDAPQEVLRAALARDVLARVRTAATASDQTWQNKAVSPTGYGYVGPLSPEMRGLLDSTLLMYPQDWVDSFDRQAHYTTSHSERAFTIDSDKHMGISGTTALVGGGTHSAIAHELMHGMENSMKSLADLSGTFWAHRVGVSAMITAKTPEMDSGYYPTSSTRIPTVRTYTLKRYKSDATIKMPGDVRPSGYEVLSTGVEDVLVTGRNDYTGDDDTELWDFTMGTLLTAGNIAASAPVTAAGESWRWQLRDKNGKWIEMGSEVKWLARGLWKQGIVIGSPSPGVATVREHLTQLIHQVPSNRLEVVRSAAEVLVKIQESAIATGEGPDWEKLGLVRYPALADFVKRAREDAVSIKGWSSTGDLIPDEILAGTTGTMDLKVYQRLRDLPPEYGVTGDEVTDLLTAQERLDETRALNLNLLKRAPRKTRKSLEKYRKLRDEGQVGIAVPVEDAAAVLEGGRYQSQFETGTSSGLLDTGVRSMEELRMLGMRTQIPEEKRPVYGYLSTPDNMAAEGVYQYGDIRFVLKPEVRDRATMTIGDSLSTRAIPVPLNGNATDEDMIQSLANPAWLGDFSVERFLADNYVETQIQGGITNDDIERIIITPRATMDVDEVESRIIPAAMRAGIPIEDQRPRPPAPTPTA